MRVLLTGATGFIGSWVARELVARGHAVRALVRPSASLQNLEGLPIDRASGDVLDADSVKKALAGCEGVIHVAGVAHFLPGDTERMYAVNVRGVEIVLGAALEAGVQRAVMTSSTAAIGGARRPRIADETTPSNSLESGIDYFISKRQGELAALALAGKGLPVCALRPVVALGPGDIYHSSATTFLAIARRKMPVYVDGGASFTDVRDIARAHVDALERGRAGETYILGGHNLEIGAMVRLVATIAGVKPPRRVPYAIAFPIAAAAELSARLRGKKTDISRQLVKASRLYTFVSSAKAERELGYRIRPFEESLRDTLKWFIEQGRLKPETPELQAIAVGS